MKKKNGKAFPKTASYRKRQKKMKVIMGGKLKKGLKV